MKRFISFLFLLLVFQFSYAAKDTAISSEQCQEASAEIIKISEEALGMAEDKKNAKKLTKYIDDWKKRLASGEDACNVYQAILKDSTSF